MAQIAPLLLTLVILFGYISAFGLVLYAVLPGQNGWRRFGLTLIPLAVGLVLVVLLVTIFRDATSDMITELLKGGLPAGQFNLSPWTARAVVAGTILSALVGVYLLAHAFPHAAARWSRWPESRRSTVKDVVRSGLLVGLVIAVVGASSAIGTFVAQGRQQSASGLVMATHPLPGTPTGIAIEPDNVHGYLTFGEGQIGRFALGGDGTELEVEIVADDLVFPRGPLIVDGRLLVVELTETACATPFPQCFTADPAEELSRINGSAARVLSFPVADDGSLGSPDEVLTDLPIVNTEHAPNSLSLGPDGFVYLPIGAPDYLVRAPDLLDDITHPQAALLGTLVRFRPDGSDLEVVSTGMRNVFAVAFDPDGRIVGVDNDGPTVRGWHHEELLEIEPGTDYGYPTQGSFDEGVTPPLWIMTATASSGLAWVEADDRGGILSGSSGRVVYVPLVADADGLYVPNRQQVRAIVTGISGFVTAIAPIGPERFVLSVFDPSGARNELLVLEVVQTDA